MSSSSVHGKSIKNESILLEIIIFIREVLLRYRVTRLINRLSSACNIKANQ
ncbi:hypothetical protein HanPSC8_Chr13g0552811 [Helianthus annuus]|nr:hypothetical protein HanPSC8_Chr13g0552811 [Helianthus annuus]